MSTSDLIKKLTEVSLDSEQQKSSKVSLISYNIKKAKNNISSDRRIVQGNSEITSKTSVSCDKEEKCKKIGRSSRKKSKKKDSFIVSDSSGDGSIIMYHQFLSEQIKTDIAKITPRRSLKKKKIFSDDGIFTPFVNQGTWKTESDSSDKENVENNQIVSKKVLQFKSDCKNFRKTDVLEKEFKKKNIDNKFDSCRANKKTSSSPLLNLKLENFSIGKKELSWCFSDIESTSESGSETQTKKSISSTDRLNVSSDDDMQLISNVITTIKRNDSISDDEVQIVKESVTPVNKRVSVSDNKLGIIKRINSPVPRKEKLKSLKRITSPTSRKEELEILKKTTPSVSRKVSIGTPITFHLNNVKKLTPVKPPVCKSTEEPSFFLNSLSTFHGPNVHADAEPYKKKFKKLKDQLAAYLFHLFNKEVFENKLPTDMKIEWSGRMRCSSGFCYNKRIKTIIGPDNECLRSSRIVLSTKIIETPERLRDTLIHEMCHAAAWIVDKTADGHGPCWRSWAVKANSRFPDLPRIKRCHDYTIKTKFKYKCVKCGYTIGRHSKSLNLERKRCGYCYGEFELIIDNEQCKNGAANTSPRNVKAKPLSKFALFVKENYGKIKAENSNLKHGEIMKVLSKNFADTKKLDSIS